MDERDIKGGVFYAANLEAFSDAGSLMQALQFYREPNVLAVVQAEGEILAIKFSKPFAMDKPEDRPDAGYKYGIVAAYKNGQGFGDVGPTLGDSRRVNALFDQFRRMGRYAPLEMVLCTYDPDYLNKLPHRMRFDAIVPDFFLMDLVKSCSEAGEQRAQPGGFLYGGKIGRSDHIEHFLKIAFSYSVSEGNKLPKSSFSWGYLKSLAGHSLGHLKSLAGYVPKDNKPLSFSFSWGYDRLEFLVNREGTDRQTLQQVWCNRRPLGEIPIRVEERPEDAQKKKKVKPNPYKELHRAVSRILYDMFTNVRQHRIPIRAAVTRDYDPSKFTDLGEVDIMGFLMESSRQLDERKRDTIPVGSGHALRARRQAKPPEKP